MKNPDVCPDIKMCKYPHCNCMPMRFSTEKDGPIRVYWNRFKTRLLLVFTAIALWESLKAFIGG